ncbi:D-serine transporter DsdX [Sinobacterium norvegicum]|uniref:D-serine transporter DsdX n=1 Tax=Sinobacterium norvegicum TaxID=1641715 RepID=A0ABN8ECZ5_9GAMM|nr:GntP family permease [Sinobacterium norvegicum]CAH0990350.1 D-serine transporter DsdX [Sinobacterium norvegicum]
MDLLTLSIIFIVTIVFIVISTTRWHLHPFLALIFAAYGVGIATGVPLLKLGETIRVGFGNILGYIGLVILFGTLIGTILEKSHAAISMANFIQRRLGERHPALAMTLIGYIVSIPVFCDSAFVILSSLRKSLISKTGASAVAVTIALSTGLYASHTFVPPTPGPIAAAANLGISDNLGMVIVVGLLVSLCAALAGYSWSRYIGDRYKTDEDLQLSVTDYEEPANLPSTGKAFAPIFVPILLIALGSVANFPSHPFGQEGLFTLFAFLGKPINALIIGFFLAMRLMPALNKETLNDWMSDGLQSAGLIIMITGAGGAFGQVLKATPMAELIGGSLDGMNISLLLPFILAAALKTAQGSSTVAMVTTSAIIAPLLGDLGLASDMGAVLAVMAVGAGAMTISHANDSYFWVVTQFSGMDVATAYRTHTVATLIQGFVALAVILILSLFLL